jgi:hypothetical protein
MAESSTARASDAEANADEQSQTLDELEKLRPPDPTHFLAHFLLRHNPRKSYQ